MATWKDGIPFYWKKQSYKLPERFLLLPDYEVFRIKEKFFLIRSQKHNYLTF